MSTPTEPDAPPLPVTMRLPVRKLDVEGETPVALVPDAETLVRLARHLDVDWLADVSLAGSLSPEGRRGWRLEARLRARVGQRCVVSLDPVETVIDSRVSRSYQPGAEAAGVIALSLGEAGEDEDDEPPEPLCDEIDLGAVLVEELALAIDPYPRAPGAGLGTVSRTPPGAAPIDETAEKPFAGLAGLRARLSGDSD